MSLLIWGLLRGYAVRHIWSTTSRSEWWLSHHPMNSYSYGICEIDHHFGRFCCTWQQLWKAAISCLQLSEDILKRNMKDWLRALLTVAGGSLLCWKLLSFFSCTSHHASISTVQFHSRQDTASTVEWSKATLFGRHPTATESSAPMKNRHETFPAGCNGCSSEDAEGLFWNQPLKPASLLGKNVASLHGSLGRPQKTFLGSDGAFSRSWPESPVESESQIIPLSHPSISGDGEIKKSHGCNDEDRTTIGGAKTPSKNTWNTWNFYPIWPKSCHHGFFNSVRFRFRLGSTNWAVKKWCNNKTHGFLILLDPGSPKEGPGLWRRWFEVTVSDWKVTKNLAKEWEIHTLQLVKLKDISYNWTFNCQQNWRTPIWKSLGIPFLWVLFDSRRGSTRSWNRWSKRPFSTTTRWPTFQQFDWLSTVQP